MGPRFGSRFARALVVVVTAVAATMLATASPALAASGPASVDIGNVPLNTTMTKDVTVTIGDGETVTGHGGTGSSGQFGLDLDTCTGFTGGGTCNVKESFTPTGAGTITALMRIFCSSTGGGLCPEADIPVLGTGIYLFAADPASVDFGGVVLNTTATRTVTITIDTGYKYSLSGGTATVPPFHLDQGTCDDGGGFIGPGTCTVTQSFTPTADGPVSGTTSLIECPTAGGTCPSLPIAVTGTGGEPAASLTPGSLTFPGRLVGTTSPVGTVTVVNTSVVPLQVHAFTVTGNFAVAPSGTCVAGGVVAAGGNCTVDVAFTPTGSGIRHGALVVDDDSTTGPHLLALTGTGIARRPAFSANPGLLTFAPQAVGTTSAAQAFVLGNPGTAPLSFSRILTSGDFLRSGGTCSTSAAVQPGRSCTVLMKFRPHTRGIRTGSLTLEDNAPGSPHSLTLTGTGAAPRLAASPSAP